MRARYPPVASLVRGCGQLAGCGSARSITLYRDRLRDTAGQQFPNDEALRRRSVSDLGAVGGLIWRCFDIRPPTLNELTAAGIMSLPHA